MPTLPRGPSSNSEEDCFLTVGGEHRFFRSTVATSGRIPRQFRQQRPPQTLILSIINSTQKNAFLYIISSPRHPCFVARKFHFITFITTALNNFISHTSCTIEAYSKRQDGWGAVSGRYLETLIKFFRCQRYGKS